MGVHFDQVTIIGAGLLGASLGLALKERDLAARVVGLGRRETSLMEAVNRGAIDEGFTELEPAIVGADLIVICTQASLVPAYLLNIRPFCSPDTVVTDVASTKSAICEHARDTWPSPTRFVGSHPMAGSEKYGPEHASADLYEGAVCFVEKAGDHMDREALDTVIALWEAVGSKVYEVDPRLHDELVARTSHIPHLVAAALAQNLEFQGEVGLFVGNGFRDTTRIAEGRPEIWRDICLTNPEAITEGLDELIETLQEISEAIAEGNAEAVEKFLEAGQAARKRALRS